MAADDQAHNKMHFCHRGSWEFNSQEIESCTSVKGVKERESTKHISENKRRNSVAAAHHAFRIFGIIWWKQSWNIGKHREVFE